MPDATDWLRPRVRTLQIITAALIAGPAAMTIMMVVLRLGNNAPANPQPILSILGAGMIAFMAALSFLVPRLMREAQLKQLAARGGVQPEQLIAVCQSTHIAGLAMLEGAVFFGAIAIFVEGQLWMLVPIVAGIGLMALRMPTEASVVAWLENAGERILDLGRQ